MKLKPNIKTIKNFSVLRPGGNDTMLIKGLVKDPAKKKLINDQMMSLYPNIEQVGFYDFNPATNTATLEMAGGEFCGNALRSLAYLILKGKAGEITARVSGTNQKLLAGVKENEAYAQIPVLKNLSSIRKITNNLYLIRLEGIVYLITKKPKDFIPKELKKLGKNLLKENGLLYSEPAAGVIFVTSNQPLLCIDPVVWVRDIQTLFYETACASGTAAVGLWKAKQSGLTFIELTIRQPSGQFINVSIERNNKEFKKAFIWGLVELIENKTIKSDGGIYD